MINYLRSNWREANQLAMFKTQRRSSTRDWSTDLNLEPQIQRLLPGGGGLQYKNDGGARRLAYRLGVENKDVGFT